MWYSSSTTRTRGALDPATIFSPCRHGKVTASPSNQTDRTGACHVWASKGHIMTIMARIGLGIGAATIIIGLVAGAHAQNTTGTQDPFMGRGGRGGFGPSGGRDG